MYKNIRFCVMSCRRRHELASSAIMLARNMMMASSKKQRNNLIPIMISYGDIRGTPKITCMEKLQIPLVRCCTSRSISSNSRSKSATGVSGWCVSSTAMVMYPLSVPLSVTYMRLDKDDLNDDEQEGKRLKRRQGHLPSVNTHDTPQHQQQPPRVSIANQTGRTTASSSSRSSSSREPPLRQRFAGAAL